MSNSMTFLRNATWGCGLVAGVSGRCVRRGWCHMLVCILLKIVGRFKVTRENFNVQEGSHR